MKQTVRSFIEKHHLFSHDDKVLVGLSGGADSVALLRLMLQLGYTCEALHCNFHLRSEESTRDEHFVRELCRRLGVSLHLYSFSTADYAAEKGISIEMAAREQRYAAFEECRKEINAAAIAVAHHKDDSVETFLLNLLRGAGMNGLRGMHPKNGLIVRPLLSVTRKDILSYLHTLSQNYVTDSTNLQEEAIRNKIRLRLLPYMREITPAADEHILQTSARLEGAFFYYQRAIAEAKRRVLDNSGNILLDALQNEPSPATLLYEILSPLGFHSAQIAKIWQSSRSAESGKQFFSNTYRLVKDRSHLLIGMKPALSDECEVQTLPDIGSMNYYGRFELSVCHIEKGPGFSPLSGKGTACLDAGFLAFPLTIRCWKQGDRFVPFGMRGSKKVSDYMTDRKFSLLQKQEQTVVCSGKQIVWLTGERIDDRYRITESTRKILLISIRPM